VGRHHNTGGPLSSMQSQAAAGARLPCSTAPVISSTVKTIILRRIFRLNALALNY
jgi:hypothetical protein